MNVNCSYLVIIGYAVLDPKVISPRTENLRTDQWNSHVYVRTSWAPQAQAQMLFPPPTPAIELLLLP